MCFTFFQVGSKSSCDLTVVSEVRGATINSNDDVTDISIKKTTTILAAEPNMSKTTEVDTFSIANRYGQFQGCTAVLTAESYIFWEN